MASRRTLSVSSVVYPMWHWICGRSIRSVRNENGVGSASPGCGSNLLQLIVRPSSRGGVPVFNRVH
jgi:hypothetical protein